MTTSPNTPPSGWYGGDVVNEERWWDGTRWTEHTRPLQLPPGTTRLLGFQSASNSLVFAIVCVVLAVPPALLVLPLLFTGNPLGLVLGLAVLAFGGISIPLFLNYSNLRKLESAPRP